MARTVFDPRQHAAGRPALPATHGDPLPGRFTRRTLRGAGRVRVERARRRECVREADVLDALQTSAWPECCGEDLHAHVRACPACAELVDVVLPLVDEHRATTRDACVPSSGSVWWRAQIRARREATTTAMRPITVLQGLSLACAAGLVAASLGFLSLAFRQTTAWLMWILAAVGAVDLPAIAWADILSFSPLGVSVALGVTMFLVLMPVAIYVAFGDE